MPSRIIVVAVLLFWAATNTVVVYREILPRLFASGPPPVSVDLADEATQLAGVNWTIRRGDDRIGRLTTRMTYSDADDTFLFTYSYTQLRLDVPPYRISMPEVVSSSRLARDGSLREQSFHGRLVVQQLTPGDEPTDLISGTMTSTGRVRDGMLQGECEWSSSLDSGRRTLPPVPVPSGQVLNPMQPVARIARPWPTGSWVVRKVDPLEEAMTTLLAEKLGPIGRRLLDKEPEELIGRMLPDEIGLKTAAGTVRCHELEFLGQRTRVRTLFRSNDGKVLRQTFSRDGQDLILDRDP